MPERAALRRLAWFGVVVSYPFYLWHMAVLRAVTDVGLNGAVAVIATFLVATLIGVASFRLVEAPAMRWARSPALPSDARTVLRRLRPAGDGQGPVTAPSSTSWAQVPSFMGDTAPRQD